MKLLNMVKGKKEGSEKENRVAQILKEAVIVQPDGIKKSSTDDRSYRHLVLENKLKVFLISDPTTENAAAAMSVNVGSYSDPPELPGLAHFLEHMLFLGTEDFKDEDEYSKFLAANGGFSNAYTASELTNYYFQCISSKLDGALERFSAFFKCPLFTESATDREINAVDNECTGNDQNDAWRSFLIFRELARKGHPVNKFNIGNVATLKEIPKEKGIDVRQALLDFYDRYYSANVMNLVVFGKESLDELEELVKRLFLAVPNKDLKSPYTFPHPIGPAFYYDIDDLTKGNLASMISVVPVRDIRKVEIFWCLGRLTEVNRRREAARAVGSLLGDEGEGSILSVLKEKGWANALSAGIADDSTYHGGFQVTVSCTDLGIKEHVNDIISVVYSYINKVKSQLESKEDTSYFFEEEKVVSAIRYWFKAKGQPYSLVSGLAARMMKDVEVEDILTGSLLQRDVFLEVKEIFKELFPENSLVFVSWKGLEDKTTNSEEYFKTKYAVESLPKDLCKAWSEASEADALGLKMTPSNKYVPSNFDVHAFVKPKAAAPAEGSSPLFVKAAANSVSQVKKLEHTDVTDKRSVVLDVVDRKLDETWEIDSFRRPLLIHSDKVSSLWLKQDTTFKRPKAYVRFKIKTQKPGESVLAALATNLYLSIVDDILNIETYAASNAGFQHSAFSDNNGVTMGFTGFAQTLDKYIELVATKFKKSTEEKIDPMLFGRFKERSMKALVNVDKARPVSLARMFISQATEEKEESVETKLKVLAGLEVNDVENFAKTLFDNVALEVYVVGNARPEDAKKYLNLGKEIFQPTEEVANHEHRRLAKLSQDEPVQYFHVQPGRNADNLNSGLTISFFFGERTDEKTALLSLLSEICYERFFNQLRTKEQLGYLVQAGMGLNRGILSLSFLVDSNSADPITLNTRVENFLDLLQKEFDPSNSESSITEEVFGNLVNAEINSIIKKSNTIGSEAAGWFRQLGSNTFAFDNGLKVAQAIANATLDDMRKFLDEYLWSNAGKRTKFVSGMLADVHGTKIFGETYQENMKEPLVSQVKLGFGEDVLKDWLQKETSPGDHEKFVASRGKIIFVSNLQEFKESCEFHKSYADILASKL